MKIGSLVECIDDKFPQTVIKYNLPKLGKVYTLRGFLNCSIGVGVYLEEIINDKMQYREMYGEKSFLISRFRELLPPISININEIIHEDVQHGL